jgi:hypothetical protein
MAERATRQMLDGIAAFRDAYKTNPKFKAVIAQADELEQAAEKLVPAAYDTTSDAADQPSNLRDASERARQEMRQARKKRAGDAEDAKDGGSDEAKEAS